MLWSFVLMGNWVCLKMVRWMPKENMLERPFKESHNWLISGIVCCHLGEVNKTHWRDLVVIFPYLFYPYVLPAAEELCGRNVWILELSGMCEPDGKAESACPLGETKPVGFNQVTRNNQGPQTNQITGWFNYHTLKLKHCSFTSLCFQKCFQFSSIYIK